jgi:hypothetical protein
VWFSRGFMHENNSCMHNAQVHQPGAIKLLTTASNLEVHKKKIC